MIEPIAVRKHGNPFALNGKQAVIDCGNGYGLDVIWAEGNRFGDADRPGHGFYAGEGTAEVILIMFNNPRPIEAPWAFDFVNLDGSRHEDMNTLQPYFQPKGWMSWPEIGELAERIAQEGFEAYNA